MTLEADNSDELDAMEEWISAMTNNIKKEAKKRGMKIAA